MFKRNKFIVGWFDQHEKMMHSHPEILFKLSTELNIKIKTFKMLIQCHRDQGPDE